MRSVPALQRDDFFRAGFELLQESGSNSVTAVALCERLSVTRGSFYHHFSSFDDYLAALLNYWSDFYTTSRRELLERVEDLGARSDLFIELSSELPHDLENAIRAWATTNPIVREAVRRVDRDRLAYVQESMRRAGCDADMATLYAHIATSAFIGLESRGLVEDKKLLRRVFEEIEWAMVTRIGAEPPQRS